MAESEVTVVKAVLIALLMLVVVSGSTLLSC